MEDGIKPLDPQDSADVENAVRLHSALLPQSPVARLGTQFMKRFYYRKLVEDGLVRCDLYSHRGTVAAFIAYTRHSSDFMTRGLRRHFLYLVRVLAGTVLRNPSRLGTVLAVLTTMLARKGHGSKAPESDGEILSFGVLPEYRSQQFVQKTGLRISYDLFNRAKEYFRRQNISKFKMLVEEDNRETLLFYHSLGCAFHKERGKHTVEVSYCME